MNRRELIAAMTASAAALTIERKALALKIDQVAESDRTFEGLAATWDLDLGGDVIHRGAFRDTIGAWRKSGEVLPLLDSHNYFSIRSALGQLLDAKETKDGLWTRWEVIPGVDGDGIMDRLRSGVVRKMSIGYIPQKFDFEEPEGEDGPLVRNLRKVELKETSLVLFPMQPGALIDLATVKSLASTGLLAADRTMLASFRDGLTQLLETASEDPPVVSPAPSNEEPDLTLLDRLKIRRLRAFGALGR